MSFGSEAANPEGVTRAKRGVATPSRKQLVQKFAWCLLFLVSAEELPRLAKSWPGGSRSCPPIARNACCPSGASERSAAERGREPRRGYPREARNCCIHALCCFPVFEPTLLPIAQSCLVLSVPFAKPGLKTAGLQIYRGSAANPLVERIYKGVGSIYKGNSVGS